MFATVSFETEWRWWDSNSWPPACKAGALPTELHPHLKKISLPKLMGLNGLEPSTSRLSGVRSNQLSYKPISIWQPPTLPCRLQHSTIGRPSLNRRVRDENGCVPWTHRHQKSLGYLIVASALVTISNPLRFFSMELLASYTSKSSTLPWKLRFQKLRTFICILARLYHIDN